MCSTESASSNPALIQSYLDYLRLEKRYSDNSIVAVQHDLSLINVPLSIVSTQVLKTILAQRHASGAAPASLSRMASSWRGFFKFLLENGHISVNPSLGLKTPKLPKSLPKALGVDPLIALLQKPLPESFRFAQAHVLVDLLYCTGLRISEALSLNAHVLSNTHELRVVGKGNKARVIPVVDSLQERFLQFSELRGNHLAKVSRPDEIKLFVSAKGAPLGVRQAQRDVAEYAASSGLGQHLHPHMLRHSFGSHVLQSTHNLRAVQELLGQVSIASTQVYTALDFDHLCGVYDTAFPRAK